MLRVLAGWFKKKSSVGPLIDDKRIYSSLRQLLGESGTAVPQPYRQSAWVYSCVDAISRNLCRVPLVLKRDAGDLEPSIIESGPLYDLFQNPNPYMTLKILEEATFKYYELRGEAIWILEGRNNITQIPKEIWTFDPIRFEPVLDEKTGWLIGWKYKGKKEVSFSVNEVIHFKRFNPYDDIRGMSPIEAVRLGVEQDYYASVYNKSFFENGAKVGGFITIPQGVDLTDEQFTRIVQQFEDRHRGADRAHKIALIEGGGTFAEAKLTQKDMEFISSKKMNKMEILAAFGVNEVVLGDYSSVKSYEGIKAAHKAFWEECLIPKTVYFEETLWSLFFSKIGQRRGKGRIWAEFELANVGPLQQNYADKIETAAKMFTMGWPINHINKRLQLGMKEVPWGDEWYVPGGFLPVTMVGNGENSEKPTKEVSEGPEAVEEAIPAHLTPLFKANFKTFLFEQRKKALSFVETGKEINKISNEKDFTKLQLSLVESYAQSINSGVWEIQRQMGEVVPMTAYAFDSCTFRDQRSRFVVGQFRALMNTVAPSLQDGNADKIRELFNFLSGKCVAIARKEAETAYKYGKELAARYVKEQLKPSLELLTENHEED